MKQIIFTLTIFLGSLASADTELLPKVCSAYSQELQETQLLSKSDAGYYGEDSFLNYTAAQVAVTEEGHITATGVSDAVFPGSGSQTWQLKLAPNATSYQGSFLVRSQVNTRPSIPTDSIVQYKVTCADDWECKYDADIEETVCFPKEHKCYDSHGIGNGDPIQIDCFTEVTPSCDPYRTRVWPNCAGGYLKH